ncbi:MAG: Ig-like domain-containing protein [Candidatus Binataceae bacterium]
MQLTATGNFTDGSTQDLTTQVSWISADDTIAQVSNVAGTQGLVTGLNTGNTTISANLNGIVGSATVTVSAATLSSITITGPVDTIAKGTTAQLTATGNFTDGSTQDLTNQVSWTSADNSIAQVSNVSGSEGLVTGINLGNTPL